MVGDQPFIASRGSNVFSINMMFREMLSMLKTVIV
jgi:hypothetical protein